ncbi:hypothetical protein ABVT39_007218 [Epinephelus coioides]
MYDNLITQVDKKEHTQTHTSFITASCQCTVSQLEGSIATLDPLSLRAKNERDRQSKREKAGVYVYERESMTVLPLNMTHTLNSLKQLGIESSLSPRKLSFHRQLLFMTQAMVSQGTARSANKLNSKCKALSLISVEI